jgi:hypothetical protein
MNGEISTQEGTLWEHLDKSKGQYHKSDKCSPNFKFKFDRNTPAALGKWDITGNV